MLALSATLSLVLLTLLGALVSPLVFGLLVGASVADRSLGDRDAAGSRRGASTPEVALLAGVAIVVAVVAASLLGTSSTGTALELITEQTGCPSSVVLSWWIGGLLASLGAVLLSRADVGRQSWLVAGFCGALIALVGVPLISVTVLPAGLIVISVAALPAGLIGFGGAAVCLTLRARGLSPLPDPARPVTDWPAGLAIGFTAAICVLLITVFVEFPAAPATVRNGVERLAGECRGFDLARTGDGKFAVVHRERRQVRSYKPAGAAPAVRPLDVLFQPDGEPEEVVGLSTDFLISHIPVALAERETRLRRWSGQGEVSAEVRVPCRVGAMRWHPPSARLLLGCKERGALYAFAPEAGTVEYIATLAPTGVSGALEDLWLRPGGPGGDGGTLYTVSLAQGTQLREVRATDGAVLREVFVGGFNYSVVYDEGTDQLYISRFLESSVLVVDAESLKVADRWRVNFGVRALAVLPGLRVLAVSSMFRNGLQLFDLDHGELLTTLALGGQTKSFEVTQDGRGLLLSTSAGLFFVDVGEVLGR